MSERKIKTLYEHYKNTPKKLKIICDWDEVIQPCEPYALWLSALEEKKLTKEYAPVSHKEHFGFFWFEEPKAKIEYSSYGSKVNEGTYGIELVESQQAIKNSPNFYQQAPFLTIAEDLLKLIKEDKVEKLIFLSAYDKRKFPNSDKRKYDIFKETFAKLAHNWRVLKDTSWREDKIWGGELNRENGYLDRINFWLIGFDNESQGANKADWIKENASDFDIFIDDNPNICKSVVENYLPRRNCGKCNKILTIESVSGYEMADDGVNISYAICQNKNCQKECDNFWKIADIRKSYNNEDEYWNSETDYTHYPTVIRKMNKPPITVITPYYPAIENQHCSDVIFVKREVSNLKKEDFSK